MRKLYKRLLALGIGLCLAASSTIISLAGEWKQDNDKGWWYQNDDNTFAKDGWHWINGKCYYFTPEGYCLIGTKTPDGYDVDGSGAWMVNGVVQVQQYTPVKGWNYVYGVWKYYFGKQYITADWKTIDGQRYYFDYDGNMVTGFQYINGDKYFFNDDGSLRTYSFTMDDIHYVVKSDGTITDEMDEFDWFSGNYETHNSNWYSDDSDDDDSDSYSNNSDWYSSYNEADESSYAYDVFEIVNREREKKNKDMLEWDDELASCAQERAYEIEESFSHTRPDGSSCFSILKEEDISYSSSGENIAYGQRTPEDVMKSWMNSSGHKKNILKTSFGRIGVGCAKINGTYYWVQIFTN